MIASQLKTPGLSRGRNGVPKAAISIEGFGDLHLLVPAGPGVRERQNRGVKINMDDRAVFLAENA